jgi:hypothetical protein
MVHLAMVHLAVAATGRPITLLATPCASAGSYQEGHS